MKTIKAYSDLAVNDAYELAYEEYLNDINSPGIILTHKKSGARICILPTEDENKVFCAGFRTTPTDSTGVPHIIEHTVLNGSKHFPLKDPFMTLVKGSLNTFLNAMTWPDKTMYPVASCNDKDFKNLMHVYLDAVFFPNIYSTKKIFMQEGWHYELDSPDDELTINGVVYSEMKGSMSSPETTSYVNLFNQILPDTTYAVNSGGDPEVIPSLTYEDYLQFHRRYYHPSNSYIFMYGNMDMDERLEFLDREYLSLFDKINPDSEIKRQTHFGESEPRRICGTYPIGSDEDTEGKAYHMYASLAASSLDAFECRACSVLANVLISADSAPVKKALNDAGIGEEIYGGFEESIDQVFNVVAKNASADDGEKFYRIIRETLEEEIKRGINEKAILACLNRMEFEFREATGGGFPVGLFYTIGMMGSWLYDDKAAFSYMHTLDDIKELKRRVGTGYYENLVRKYMLDSDHSVLYTMLPEPGLFEKRENKLKEKLAAYKASLSAEEIDTIVRETAELREYQSTPPTEEEKNCIPVLERSDIPREGIPYIFEERKLSGIPAVYHDLETNGVTYLTLSFALDKIPTKYIPYVGLLADTICAVDSENHTYQDLDIEIMLRTGELSFDVTEYRTDDGFKPTLQIVAKVMPENISVLFSLLAEVITTSHYEDSKRMNTLIAEIRSEKQREIVERGDLVGTARAISYFDTMEKYIQYHSGFDYYFFVKNLDADDSALAENLKKVSAYVFKSANLTISFGCDKAGYEELEANLSAFVSAIDSVPAVSLGEEDEIVPENKKEGIMIPSAVNFVCRAGNYIKNGVPYMPECNVVRTSIRTDYLYQMIRVQGGAYGCGIRFRGTSGIMSFSSFRDPNLEKTDEVYMNTPEFVRNVEFDETDLTRTIIGTFSEIERPLSPYQKIVRSFSAYMIGDTTEKMNERRAAMLDIDEEGFRKVADAIEAGLKDDCFCVVGNEKAIRENSKLFDNIVSI